MDIQEFHAERRKALEKLTRDLLASKYEGQPELEEEFDPDQEKLVKKPVAIYMTSVRKREAGVTGGHTCLTTIERAAYLIADGTHRVATKDEIRANLKRQLDQKRLHDKQEAKSKIQRQVRVTEEELNEVPAHLLALEAETKQQSAAGGRK